MLNPPRRSIWFIIGLLSSTWAIGASAQEATRTRTWNEQRWGLGFTFRTANIPFATEERTVATLIPLILYEGKRVYIYETEGGFKFLETPRWRVSAMGRMHFFDIPSQYQNQIQGDRADWGAQVRFKPRDALFFDLEALSDLEGHASGHARVGTEVTRNRFRLQAWGDARFTTSHYNSLFWGLGQEEVDGGVDLSLGVKGYLQVISSLYLQGALGATYLSKPVREASLVKDDYRVMGFLGFGLSKARLGPTDRPLETTPYWRLSHQWGTPSSLERIIKFQVKPDPYGSQLTTLFYGLPLTDRLFTLPIHVYLHSGLGWHWASDYQDHSVEGVVSIKLYYTIPLPWRIRVGFAEGVSFNTEVTALERNNNEKKGYQPSETQNYLDPSVDINLGDIVPWRPLRGVWLGYYIHHRSAIFETAQQFGRIKGGSNFRGIYVKFERGVR
ncbi:MAG: MipA/OmpV family protein [Longimicrobiales bacterium]